MTKTWRTSCPDCAQPVFFFSCTCGSKVFFDRLGDPWPLHEDVCVGHMVRWLRNADGLSYAQIERRIEAEAERRGTSVPKNVRTLMRSLNFRETGEPTILDLTPGVEPREFVGTVMAMDRINFFKRLEVPDNAMSRKLLGSLLSEEHAALVIRAKVNERTGFAPQIEALATRTMLEEETVRRGMVVDVRVRPLAMGKERMWIVERLRVEDC